MLRPDITLADRSLRKHLDTSKRTAQAYTDSPFEFFSQIEDPSVIYIIAEWESPESHMEGSIPKPANQELLTMLGDLVDFKSLFHIDEVRGSLPWHAPIISIQREFVKDGQREAYGRIFDVVEPYIRQSDAPHSYLHGWRMERRSNKDEAVLISGWEDVAAYQAFAETSKSNQFARLQGFVDRSETTHAKRLEEHVKAVL